MIKEIFENLFEPASEGDIVDRNDDVFRAVHEFLQRMAPLFNKNREQWSDLELSVISEYEGRDDLDSPVGGWPNLAMVWFGDSRAIDNYNARKTIKMYKIWKNQNNISDEISS